MTCSPAQVTVSVGTAGTARLLTLSGVLDSSSYTQLRDTVIKAALDEPAAVLVDVTGLEAPAISAWSVFTSARWHVSTWPDVPIVLVCPDAAMADAIRRSGVTRYVPVAATVDAALRAVTSGGGSRRRRASATLPATLAAPRRSRALVAEWLAMWSLDELIPAAKVIVDVLVTNVLRHTESSPILVAEATGSTITIAVQDASTAPAVRREAPGGGVKPVSGLAVVAALSRSWGSMPTPLGKTVWAVIGPENRL